MRGFSRKPFWLSAALSALVLTACSEGTLLVHGAKRMAQTDDEGGGIYKVGTPYEIMGVWYYPKVDYDYIETGVASWYGPNFHGKPTANGEVFDQNLVSAAHRTLPLPSMVRVTNLENGRSVKVRVNDRGPFAHGRIIDMSRQGAMLLGFHRQGTAKVRVEVLAQESRQLAALYGAGGADGPQLARANLPDDEKPPVTAAPRVAVEAAPLEGAPQPESQRDSPVGETQTAYRTPSPPLEVRTAVADPKVEQMPVGPSSMYVQAGAFTQYDNANRLRARLSVLGPTEVSQVEIGDQIFFRVRLGPLNNVDSADALLERVIGAGHEEARLVVE